MDDEQKKREQAFNDASEGSREVLKTAKNAKDNFEKLGNATIKADQKVANLAKDIHNEGGIGQYSKNRVDNAKEKIGDTAENIKDAAQSAGNAIKNAPENIKNAAQSAGNAVKNAPENIKNAAQSAGNAVKNAPGNVKDAAKNGANKVKQGASNAKSAVKNAPKNAKNAAKNGAKKAKQAVKQAPQKIKQAAKQAPRKAAKKAKEGAKKAANKILQKIINKIFAWAGGVQAIFIFICFIIIVNTPGMILSALGLTGWNDRSYEIAEKKYEQRIEEAQAELDKLAGKENVDWTDIDELQKAIDSAQSAKTANKRSNFMANVVTNISVWAKDFYFDKKYGKITVVKANGDRAAVTDAEAKELFEAKNYDEVLRYYCGVLDTYLGYAYDEAIKKIEKQASSSGKDVEKTMEELNAQGNPISNANYAVLLAAYSTTHDSQTANFVSLKSGLNKASKNFLDYELKKKTYNKITPYVVYEYEKTETKEVDALKYYKTFGDGSVEVEYAQKDSINTELSLIEEKYESLAEDEKKEADEKRKALQEELKNLTAETSKVERILYVNGTEISKAKITTDLYKRKLDENKHPIVKDTITDTERGSLIYDYKLFEKSSNTYGVQAKADIYIRNKYMERVYPTSENKEYFEVEWTTFDCSMESALGYFGLDKDDIDKVSTQRVNIDYVYDEEYREAFKQFLEEKGSDKTTATYITTESEDEEILQMAREINPNKYISYREDYSQYYNTLEKKIDALNLGSYTGSGETYGDTLSENDINKYLDDAKKAYKSVEKKPQLDGKEVKELSKNRQEIIKVGLSMVGRISYQLSGKHDQYGIKKTWGKRTGSPKYPYVGLDCSGYVQWVIRNAMCEEGGKNPDNVHSQIGDTGAVCSNCIEINENELSPGDLGTYFVGGSDTSSGTYNHVGIYLGNGKWVHCTSGKSMTVVVGTPKFKKFWRLPTKRIEKDNYWKDGMPSFFSDDYSVGTNSTKDERYVCAHVLKGESGATEGFKACTEAAYNYATYHKRTLHDALTNQIGPEYCEAYTIIYKEGRDYCGAPTKEQLKIVEDICSGKYKYKYFSKNAYSGLVMYWLSTSYYHKHGKPGWNKSIQVARDVADNTFFYVPGEK